MNRSELQSAEITAVVRPLVRARHMPDGAISRGEQRSLPDKPIPAPTWDHAGSGGGVDDLPRSGSPGWPELTTMAPITGGIRASMTVPCWRCCVSSQQDRRSGLSAGIRYIWLIQADIGDVRQDLAFAEGAGDSDAVVPVKHVVLATASIEVHGVHSAAGQYAGGYPLKARSRHL